jgi:hypothetical protein
MCVCVCVCVCVLRPKFSVIVLPISAIFFPHKILWFFGPKIEENFGNFWENFGGFFSILNLTNFGNFWGIFWGFLSSVNSTNFANFLEPNTY